MSTTIIAAGCLHPSIPADSDVMPHHWRPTLQLPVEDAARQYKDAADRLAQLGYDILEVDHLDVDDVVIPLDLFTRLANDLAGYRAQAYDAAAIWPR